MRVIKYLGNVLAIAVTVVILLIALPIGLKAAGLLDPALEALGVAVPQSQAIPSNGDATQSAGPTAQGRAEPSDPAATPEVVTAPDTAPVDVGSPSMDVDPVTATEAVHRYVANQPWYGPQEMGTSIVDTVVVEDDDVIVTLVTDLEANATETYAPTVLADVTGALRAHPDDPALQGLDLAAIYSQDGGMVAYESLWR